ncbi:MAG: TraB/GumN family protein [Chitinophagaceae bacterium]
MNTWFRLITALLIFSGCKAQPAAPVLPTNKDDNTLLWEVSGAGLERPSYLFGTFHLMCKSDIHFSPALRTALQAAKLVYMEMDMDDPSVLLGGMLLMNMKDGKELKDFYTAEEYKKVEIFFRDTIGTPLQLFKRMKPMMLESMLYPKMMPCKTMSGVEEELMKMAKIDKKEIKGLETIEFQSSVFDSIPYAEQAKDLLKTIDSMAAYRQYFDTMLTVYKSQQIDEIEKMFNKSEFGMEDNKDLLLDKRNKNWVLQLKKIMQEQSIFVAVGAGHLPGSMGLIQLLRKEGYTLKPLLNK